MDFRDIHQRLVAQVRARMRNGELTERALARHLGISQPHVNNVLRGRRKLSPEIADLILKFFHYSPLDLYAEFELRSNLLCRLLPDHRGPPVKIVKRPIGPGSEWILTTDCHRQYRLPCPVRGIPECMLFARLASDKRMPALLCDCDIALIDTSISSRLADCPSAIFAVQNGRDTLLRWIRSGFHKLYIADEQTINRPFEWEILEMREEQRLQYVKGRVLWLGSEDALRRV